MFICSRLDHVLVRRTTVSGKTRYKGRLIRMLSPWVFLKRTAPVLPKESSPAQRARPPQRPAGCSTPLLISVTNMLPKHLNTKGRRLALSSSSYTWATRPYQKVNLYVINVCILNYDKLCIYCVCMLINWIWMSSWVSAGIQSQTKVHFRQQNLGNFSSFCLKGAFSLWVSVESIELIQLMWATRHGLFLCLPSSMKATISSPLEDSCEKARPPHHSALQNFWRTEIEIEILWIKKY